MVSPLGSLVANSRQQSLPQLGDTIRQSALLNSQLKSQALQRENLQQQMGQRSSAQEDQKNLGAARYLNHLGKQLLSTEESQWGQILSPNIPQLEKMGMTPEMLQGLSREKVQGIVAQTEPLIGGQTQKTGSERERELLMRDLEGGIDPESGQLKPIEELTAKELAAARALNLVARPVGSASQTIAATGTSENVAQSEATIAGAKEGAKLKAQKAWRPAIQKSIKLAEADAKARGETLTDYKRAKATMPAVEEIVGQLKALAPVATSTLGGKAFDSVVKESGFGATKGSTARAKYSAIVDNQVLPLLKQTFGAAFTVEEMRALKATMGDVDASPTAKQAQLEAFIEGKYREIESKERELDTPEAEEAPEQQLQEGVIIRNPQTGERMQLKNGQWVAL